MAAKKTTLDNLVRVPLTDDLVDHLDELHIDLSEAIDLSPRLLTGAFVSSA